MKLLQHNRLGASAAELHCNVSRRLKKQHTILDVLQGDLVSKSVPELEQDSIGSWVRVLGFRSRGVRVAGR